jgi:polyphosphate kinase
MHRNLDRRVEALVRVTDPSTQAELIGVLDLSMSEEVSAFDLGPDGIWRLHEGDARDGSRRTEHVQSALLRRIVGRAD